MCRACDAPGDHSTTGDCRAAQRKEIQRLRGENRILREKMVEYEKMYDLAKRTFDAERKKS